MYGRLYVSPNKIIIYFLVISLAGLGGIYEYGEYVTHLFLPLAIYSLIINNNLLVKSLNSRLLVFYTLFTIVALLTTPLAKNVDSAFSSIKTMVMIIMIILFTTEYCRNRNYDYRPVFLYGIVFGAFISDCILLLSSQSIHDLSSMEKEFYLNPNAYSYANFFALASLLVLEKLKPLKYHKYYTLFFLFLGIYVSFITASRQALILLTLLFISSYVIQKKIDMKSKVIYFLLMVASLIIIFFIFFSDSITETFLYKRLERLQHQNIEEIRFRLAIDSIDVFFNNFWTGVGPAQYLEHNGVGKPVFSHNSFTEAAANFGILGLFFFGGFYFTPFRALFMKYKHNKVNQHDFILLIIILLATLLYQFFYVFYLYPVFIIFYVVLYEIIIDQ